jgi:hypothetical protein
MKLQLVLALLLVAIAAVFANTAAPAAAAAKFDIESSPAFKKLSESVTKSNEATVLKVKSLVDEISTLKKAVETLAKENSALKATLEKRGSGDAGVSARVTKLDELVSVIGKQVDELKAVVAESSVYNQATKFAALAKVEAAKYYAIAAAKSQVYFAEASVFAEKNAGPAFANFKVKAVAFSHKAVDEATVAYKVYRQKLTDFLLAKGVPAKHAPFAALVIIALAAFVVALVLFSLLVKILGFVFSILCCCCRKTSKKAAAPANAGKAVPRK